MGFRLTRDSWRDAQACAVSTCMRHGMRAHRSSLTPLDQRPCSRGSRQPHVRMCPVHDAPLGRGSWRVRTRAGCTVMRDAGLRAVARVEDAPKLLVVLDTDGRWDATSVEDVASHVRRAVSAKRAKECQESDSACPCSIPSGHTGPRGSAARCGRTIGSRARCCGTQSPSPYPSGTRRAWARA